jgi:hypothetical protein
MEFYIALKIHDGPHATKKMQLETTTPHQRAAVLPSPRVLSKSEDEPVSPVGSYDFTRDG